MSDLGHEDIPFAFFSRIFDTMSTTPRHTFQVLTKRPAPLLSRVRRWYSEQGRQDPLKNLWLGVSVENQRWASVRIPLLLRLPAAVRFLSCEPLLGPIDLSEWLGADEPEIQWVIAGGESGAAWRPMDHRWAQSLRDQCREARVAFFYKQGAGPRPEMDRELDGRQWEEMPTIATISRQSSAFALP